MNPTRDGSGSVKSLSWPANERHLLLGLALAGVLGLALGGALPAGSGVAVMVQALLWVPGIFSALSLATTVLIIFCIAWLSGPSGLSQNQRIALLITGGLAFLFAGALGGTLLRESMGIRMVRHYVERAVPVLNDFAARNGTYPEELPVELLGRPPELLRHTRADDGTGRETYSYRGSALSFTFWYSTGISIDHWSYDSETRRWTYVD